MLIVIIAVRKIVMKLVVISELASIPSKAVVFEEHDVIYMMRDSWRASGCRNTERKTKVIRERTWYIQEIRKKGDQP